MVSFILNGSEITTWMGVELQIQKPKIESNILKSFSNLKQQAGDY